MAASLHSYGVKIPCHRSVRNSRFRSNVLNPLNWLRFSDSMALNSRLFRAAIGDSSRRRAMKKLVKVGGNKGRVEAVLKEELEERFSDGDAEDFTCVMKFGGSSVASAERMREIADLILTFPEERPVVVLSAMGKTTNKLLVYDAFDIGFITTDDFTNADILEATYPAIAKRLHGDWVNDPAIPIVTGFLGKGWKSGAITTLGRGGSDLTATTIGKALGLREIQVWKDVDGVLTCDPTIYTRAEPVPYLTFDEAAELAYFGAQVLHPQSMRPAREGDIPVRVKNSYNCQAPGTLITKTRDMSKAVLTSIVLKQNVTMLDIVSTRMLGQFGFLAKVFSIFEDLGISVDVVATSEELDHVVEELEKIAVVDLLQHRSIISLIGNVQRSSLILEKVFHVLQTKGVNVQMISQGASKVNISLIVNDSEAEQCVKALHRSFFESVDLTELVLDDEFGNGSPLPLRVENQ
ncbi:Aspartokinase 1, chloroplastic [Morella rubra]|uniref:Aspartokinase n=1 Tax=Morella rubra TaxID=262757 RepID=A0A6A1V4N3_9ROSI|nr:Aspartokinase 1, chloroplastic [Morella rubra]